MLIAIGIVLLPDENTAKVAQYLQGQCLERLAAYDIIDLANYQKEYPNIFHLSLYQIIISQEALADLRKELITLLTHIKPFNFSMDDGLQDTQENIWWASSSAKKLGEFQELRKLVMKKTDEVCQHADIFSQIKAIDLSKLSHAEKIAIENYGVTWGTGCNFDPHITLVYNSGKDRKDIKIADCINNISVPASLNFYPQTMAIAQLGLAGNIEKLLHKFDLTM